MTVHYVHPHLRGNPPYLVRGYFRGLGSTTRREFRKQFANSSPDVFRSDYYAAREDMPPGVRWRASLSALNEARCKQGDGIFHKTPGGSCIGVANDGDVIAHAHSQKDEVSARELIVQAASCGGERIDGYDGLFEDYRAASFVPVAWCKWDARFAPDDYKPEYAPEDLIFYIHENALGEEDAELIKNADDMEAWKAKVPPCDSYEDAKAARDDTYREIKRKQFDNTSPEEFVENLVKAKESVDPEDAWRVSVLTKQEIEEEHPGAILFTSPGGSVAAVAADGDIFGVCRDSDDTMSGVELIGEAVKAGGTKLDSYEGNHAFYLKAGFIPVSWCKWEEAYAPEDWTPEYRAEDIVFYIRRDLAPANLAERDYSNININAWKKEVPPSVNYEEANISRNIFLD